MKSHVIIRIMGSAGSVVYSFDGIFRLEVGRRLGAVLVVSGQHIHDEGKQYDVCKNLQRKRFCAAYMTHETEINRLQGWAGSSSKETNFL